MHSGAESTVARMNDQELARLRNAARSLARELFDREDRGGGNLLVGGIDMDVKNVCSLLRSHRSRGAAVIFGCALATVIVLVSSGALSATVPSPAISVEKCAPIEAGSPASPT